MHARWSWLGFLIVGVLASASASAHVEPIHARQQRLEQRIAHGRLNGTLTRPEAHRLQHRSHAMQHLQLHFARDARLGARERVALHRQQQRLSRAIFMEKHDRQHRCR